MTAQNESSASEVMDELGSRYVVIDYETALPKYPVIITWAGGNRDDYYDAFWYENHKPVARFTNCQYGIQGTISQYALGYITSAHRL